MQLALVAPRDSPSSLVDAFMSTTRTAGEGAPLLLIHPAPRSSLIYKRLMLKLPNFRTIAPDLPGFGVSCDLPAGSTMSMVASNIADVLDGLRVNSAHVFGLHSGNKVGAAFAASHAEQVRKFVFAGMTRWTTSTAIARGRVGLHHHLEARTECRVQST